MAIDQEECANCRFFAETRDGSGMCRRYAPRQTLNPFRYVSGPLLKFLLGKIGVQIELDDAKAFVSEKAEAFPLVDLMDWCGEWVAASWVNTASGENATATPQSLDLGR